MAGVGSMASLLIGAGRPQQQTVRPAMPSISQSLPRISTPAPMPIAAPAPVGSSLAQNLAAQAGAKNVYQGPVFSQVLPFQKGWEALLPTVEAEGASQINPFVQRDLNTQTRSFTNQLAASGGGRLGRATGGLGSIQAEAERSRKAQLLDWVNQRKSGYENLFYKPAEQAFNKSIELGQTPKTPKVPTYEEFTKSIGGSPMANALNQKPQGLKFSTFNY